MYTVILAGGSGTRLLPISTEENPKQFLSLINDKSLLQNTVERILSIDENPQNIAISTNINYKNQTLQQLENTYGVNTVISEPERRNTAPAIAYTIKYLEEKKEAKSEDLILICPSDQHIAPTQKFVDCIQQGIKFAQDGKIVLFGIHPDKPETGYGYIKADGESTALAISEFKEKPDLPTAQKYLEDGSYFWNAGIFLFSVKTMKEEFKNLAPEIAQYMDLPFEQFVEKFSELPKISIDYAIMEKTKKSILIPMDLERSDLGNRDAVWKYGNKDKDGNLLIGNQKLSYPNILI